MTETARKIVEQPVAFLVSGTELAKDVYSEYGNVLINQGTVVTQPIIKKLETWNIQNVSIWSEVTEQVIADPALQKFLNTYNQSVDVVEQAFDTIRQTRMLPLATFRKTADDLAQNLTTAGNVIDQLYNLPPCDDYTFRHSVNVSVIAGLIALWLKYPPESIHAISLAGLLHDVGKSLLPPKLVNRPHKLSTDHYEAYKQHVTLGYELLSKVPGIAESVRLGVTDHHEREDGSGYPQGLSGADIHPYAKIIAIADLYDEALTINRDPGMLSPYCSIEKLQHEVYRLDPKACLTFISHMTNFLTGDPVMLTNGSKGRVVCTNKRWPSRSIVQLEDGTVLDLNDGGDIRISHIIR